MDAVWLVVLVVIGFKLLDFGFPQWSNTLVCLLLLKVLLVFDWFWLVLCFVLIFLVFVWVFFSSFFWGISNMVHTSHTDTHSRVVLQRKGWRSRVPPPSAGLLGIVCGHPRHKHSVIQILAMISNSEMCGVDCCKWNPSVEPHKHTHTRIFLLSPS